MRQDADHRGVQQVVKQALFAARDVFLPPTCLACDNSVDKQGMVCANCWSALRFIEKPFCAVSGAPFSYDLGKGVLSAAVIADPPVYDRARAVVLYDDVARRLVQGLKFSDRTDLAPWLAAWMVRASDGILSENSVIVPVPLHRRRLFGRRYNQSAELARSIAAQCGLSYQPEILTRVRATKQQVGLGKKERDKNVRGAFRVPAARKIDVKGNDIVLIDDVYTTGSTVQACSRALRRVGARQIECLTFARVANGVTIVDV